MSKILFNEKLYKYFPFLEWLSLLKDKNILRGDIIAGITVALVVIPQSMAYASLAGLPIQVGLYTAFIPLMVGALFGSSRQMSTGPVTIISLMTATALIPIALSNPDEYVIYASILAFFIGLFYLILGSLRLGIIVDFLSQPVIIGFTNAVAIITITSQISKIFGINPEKGTNYFEGIYNIIIQIFTSTHHLTLLIGVFGILVLIFLKTYFPKLPRVLIVLFFSIIISGLIGYKDKGGDVIGYIPEGLPSFSIPFLNTNLFSLGFESVLNLAFFAIIIGLIGFTESISVAKYVGSHTKQRVSANRELFGQGLANISSSLFGGYGVAGSFSKTAVNLRAGAKTGLASIITGLIVAISLLYFTPMLFNLPTATLAAIIIVAVAHLIKIKPIIKSYSIDIHDGIVAIATFILTLMLAPKIENGIMIGVLASIIFFIYRSMRPQLVEVSMYEDGNLRDAELFKLKTSRQISVYRFDGVLYFANAGYFESKILDLVKKKDKLKFVIIDLEWISDIDMSGLEVLESVINNLKERNIKVLLASIRVKVAQKFINSSFLKRFGKENTFVNMKDALDFLENRCSKNIDLGHLFDYRPKKKRSEGKKILENI